MLRGSKETYRNRDLFGIQCKVNARITASGRCSNSILTFESNSAGGEIVFIPRCVLPLRQSLGVNIVTVLTNKFLLGPHTDHNEGEYMTIYRIHEQMPAAVITPIH